MSLVKHLFLPHHTNNQRAKILHPKGLFLIITLFVIFQLSLYKTSLTLPNILGFASQISPTEIVRLTNEERRQRNLPSLKFNEKLSKAAAAKAADMFAKNYWAHVSPSGTQPWFFITESGYSYRYAGENLARDFSDPNSVVVAWMNSQTHKDNLLNSRYQDIGVAVVDGTLEGRETTLVVQLFGTQLTSQPKVSDTSTEISVQAKEVVTTPVPVISQISHTEIKPELSPFEITKSVSIVMLALLIFVLVLDVIIINKFKIVRWTSKSFAHLIFIFIILIAITTIIRGKII